MKLAFFRQKYGGFYAKLIHLRSGSEFSHVEFVLTGPRESDGRSLCFSAEIGQGVRHKWIGVENDPKWELVELPKISWESYFKIIKHTEYLRGRDYDLKAIL